MIELSNGHKFEYMAASGALGYNGRGWLWERPLTWDCVDLLKPELFTIVAKTVTFNPQKGNPFWRSLGFVSGGVINAMGLGNPGFNWWHEMMRRYFARNESNVIASYAGSNKEVIRMVEKTKIPVRGIEINVSCPNVFENTKLDKSPGTTMNIVNLCQELKKVSLFPLILKLSVRQDIITIIEQLQKAVEAISINSVPWHMIYPDKKSPLSRYGGGGVSGQAAQKHTWLAVSQIARMDSIPVIGPSIWKEGDLDELRRIGAQALSFGSIFLKHPLRPTQFVINDMAKSLIVKNKPLSI